MAEIGPSSTPGVDVRVKKKEISEKLIGGSSKTVFIFYIRAGGEEWTIERRFNDFFTLRNILAKSVGDLPAIPAKTLGGVSEIMKKIRFDTFEKFLKVIARRCEVLVHPEFREFLEIDKYVPGLNITHILMEERFMVRKGGISSFQVDPSRDMLAICTTTPKLTSRYISTIIL